MTDPDRRNIVVVGAGIAGAAAVHHLATRHGDRVEVTLIERTGRIGGKLSDTPFAGVDHVDEAADAFLTRVPDAIELATEVGLADDLVHPEAVRAAVWHGGLHPIPSGLVLGVPSDLTALMRSSLLSWRGKTRAAIEPLLPRRSIDHDILGRYVRERFGDEVHERIVDALVGSIYANDTDDFSLAEVPQIASLARHRSPILSALSQRRTARNAIRAQPALFATPRTGAAALAEAAVRAAKDDGAEVLLGVGADVRRSGTRWSVVDRQFDAVVLTGTKGAIAGTLAPVTAEDPSLAESLNAAVDVIDVAMVTLHVPEHEWPDRLHGFSGYLVPKPVQRQVTAASFASQKWNHWRPPTGGEILRVSLGRQGAPVLHFDDDELLEATLADLHTHLGCSFNPHEVRITRWPDAFAHYRPHHRRWVEEVRSRLPKGVFVAGSGFDGMGVPACVRSGKMVAEQASQHVAALAG